MQVQTPMSFINIDILSNLMSKYSNHERVSSAFNEINELCHLQLKYSRPESIIQTARKINVRQAFSSYSQEQAHQKKSLNWTFGEFKIFIWVIIYEQLTNQVELKEFTEQTITEIRSIFTSKSIPFIRYEVKLLGSHKTSLPQVWAKDELSTFQSIMRRFGNEEVLNWKLISFALFTQSQCNFFRNLNHCREKWNNHLNPHVNKENWTVQEDIRLFELVDEHGLKWSKISKWMGNTRTEHMVKNRLWKANKNTPVSSIRSIFKNRIEKGYFRKKASRREEQVKLNVLIEEGSDEKGMESDEATIKIFSNDHLALEGFQETVKQQNEDEGHQVRMEGDSAKKQDQRVQQALEKNKKGWDFYPFLNVFLPQPLQSNPVYYF